MPTPQMGPFHQPALGPVKLVLFDVDGTLVSTRGAGRRALERAMRDVYDTAGDIEAYDFHGKTDPLIVRHLLSAVGKRPEAIEAGLASCFTRYLVHLEREIGDGAEVTLYPGVNELVDALARREDVLLGLLTGNVEGGARIKLSPTGLLPYFRLGAYGSDSGDRTVLPAIAAERARSLTGRVFPGDAVMIVGDTPLDIECARAYGAWVAAVATGRHTFQDLALHRPDFLFHDFSQTEAVLMALLNGT